MISALLKCDSECAVCNRIATPAEGIKQCGSCPCTVHQDCLPEVMYCSAVPVDKQFLHPFSYFMLISQDEVTESAEYYCSDCRDTDKIVWKVNLDSFGIIVMQTGLSWCFLGKWCRHDEICQEMEEQQLRSSGQHTLWCKNKNVH